MSEHLSEATIARVADREEVPPSHLRECARCSNALVAALQLKRAVREVTPRVAVPESLRARLSASRMRPRPRSWWPALAAAAIVAIVISGAIEQARNSAARELVDLHSTIVGAVNPIDVVSTDRHTVKPWFEGRVPFAVDVPELAGTPLHLLGGRVVFWRGEPGAYMLVSKGAHRISLFEFRADGAPSFGRIDSMTIESWEKNGVKYIAIADVPRSDLNALRR